MKAIDMEDALLIIRDYIELMWSLHTKYESSINPKELTQYKLGIQVFLLEIKKELDLVLKDEESE